MLQANSDQNLQQGQDPSLRTVQTTAFVFKEFGSVDEGFQYVISECEKQKLTWYPVTSTAICGKPSFDQLGCSAYLSLVRCANNTSYVQGFTNHNCFESQRPLVPPIQNVAPQKSERAAANEKAELKKDILNDVKSMLDGFLGELKKTKHKKKRRRSAVKSSSSITNPKKKLNQNDSSQSTEDSGSDNVFAESEVKESQPQESQLTESEVKESQLKESEVTESHIEESQDFLTPKESPSQKDIHARENSDSIVGQLSDEPDTREAAAESERNTEAESATTVKPKKVSRAMIKKYLTEMIKSLEQGREEAIRKALEIKAKIPEIKVCDDLDYSTKATDRLTENLLKKFDKKKLRRRRPLYTNAAGKIFYFLIFFFHYKQNIELSE